MSSNRSKCPKITWGASFANTLNIGYPLDTVKAGSDPRAGSAFDQSPSGVEDSWIVGTDYTLTGDVRWIPQANTSTPLATGWDTATTGFRLFLEWARAKNVLRWYPDVAVNSYIACYLVDPMKGPPDSEADGTRKLTLVLRNATAAFDGY